MIQFFYKTCGSTALESIFHLIITNSIIFAPAAFCFNKKNTVPKRVYMNNLFLKETNEELKVSDKFEEKYVVYKVIETDLKTKKYFVKELIYCG